MNIQSLSIVVPTKRCVNNCPFCVSKMHDNEYSENLSNFYDLRRRLLYALNNGVNTVILTGTGEALQNIPFLENLFNIFDSMGNPFPNIELQTTGVLLNKITRVNAKEGKPYHYNIKQLKKLCVSTVSLSVSNIFDDDRNMEVIGTPKNSHFKLSEVISVLKEEGFNIRLSLNMIKDYDEYKPKEIIDRCKELGADQVTFRKLFNAGTEGEEDTWVRENSCKDSLILSIENYIRLHGNRLYQLPYGPVVYSIDEMSTVLDDDCMGKHNDDSLKYLILRENGKLYCRWDDKGSLIF